MYKLLIVFTLVIATFSQNLFAVDLLISNSEVRSPIPGMANTVGYMTLLNNSKAEVTIVSAKSNSAEKVEIHNHIMVNSVMKMVKVDKLVMQPQEEVTFESGGLHLMFIGLEAWPHNDGSVLVTFALSDNREFTREFQVKSIQQHHHH